MENDMTINNSRFKKYKLKRKEEVKYLNNINNLLKNYEKDLKSISSENSEFNIILHGHKICELMLELTLKKEGHSPPNITPIIQYCMTTKIFNYTCKNHLQKIKMIRNKIVNEKTPNPNMSYNFLISFDYFIMWFNDYYDSYLLIRNDLKIERYHNLIKSILQNQDPTVQHNTKPQTYNNFELDYISEINKLLKEYEKEIKLIPDENANYVIIFSGLRICDLMIELYLKENDYPVSNDVVTEKRKKNSTYFILY